MISMQPRDWGAAALSAECGKKSGHAAPLPPGEGGRYSGRVRAWHTGYSRVTAVFLWRDSASFVFPRPHPAGRPATLSWRERGKLPGFLGITLLAAITLLTAGCASPPPPAEKIKLADLRPTVHSQPQVSEESGLLVDPGTLPARAIITRLEIPRKVSLAPLSSLLTDHGLPPAMVDLWRKNGLCVGIMDAARGQELIAAFPDALDTRAQLRIRAPFACPLWMTEPLHAPRSVSLTLGPKPKDHVIKEFAAGRFQILIRLVDAENNGVTVELRPHVFLPQQTLEVRTPMEKSLDGTIYDELTLSIDLAPNQLLVIAPEPSAPPHVAASQPSTQQRSGPKAGPPVKVKSPAATQPATQPATRIAPIEAPSAKLGDMILTGWRQNLPIQAIWVIGVHHSNAMGIVAATPSQ